LFLAFLVSACFGGLPRDPVARAIVLAPGEAIDLPLHEDRTHWFMRDLPRWCGAAEARWGGDPGDRAVLTVRAIHFRDENAAARALDRLTPEYLALALRDRIADGPYPIDYQAPLPGQEAKVNLYGVRLPPETAADVQLTGQLTAVRSGAAIILTETIGIPADELIPTFEAMVRAGEQAQSGC
jgi:hypothetical protein